jgi:purine-binding chemotaxis protein CheW
MDILAARKKAAERAKAGRHDPAPQPLPVRDEERLEEDAPAFPPLPETEFVPEEAAPVADVHPASHEPEGVRAAPPPAMAEPLTPGPAPANARTDMPAAPDVAESEAEEQDEVEHEQETEMLAFLLGTEEYVLPVERVQEVLTPREITPIPHSKEFILGVCSLRGVVLPIIDLHRRLGLAEAAGDERSRIIVLNLGPDDRIGLFVDRVRGVVRFLPSLVRPVPETIEQGAEFLQGIVRKDDRLLILLDAQKTTEI